MADGNKRYKSDKKVYKVSFKLSETELLKLESDAKKAGKNRSEYLRELVKNSKGVDTTFATDRSSFIRQITGIATNDLDMGFAIPRFISSNPTYLYQKGLSEFQLKFYHKMYRVRMVEQNRFDKNASWMARELQRFHQLQDQYLFLVRNDIKSVENLVTYEYFKGDRLERISARQKEIYKESGNRKRACKTEDDIRDFQIWHMQAQEELDALKAEKKEIRNNLKLVEGCKQEYKRFTMVDLASIEEEVRNTVRVPEYPFAEEPVREDLDEAENYEYSELKKVRESVAESVVDIGDVGDVEAGIEVAVVETEAVENALIEDVTVEESVEIAEVTADAKNSLPSYEVFKKYDAGRKGEYLGL